MIRASLKHHMGVLLAGVILAAAAIASAAEPIALSASAECVFGGDIRIRQVHFDQIPIVADPPGVTRGGENHFFRFRTRLWTRANFSEQVGIYARLVNEFRHYETGADKNWDWPDEAVIDALFLDLKGMYGGMVDARIGRQDIIYGTGKLVLEGTPKDGSRTLYHDAVRLSVHTGEKNTIDFFGIYNQPENQLALGSENRDLTGYDPAFNDVTESGAGIYMMNRQLETCPFEAYYIYKRESSWITRNEEEIRGRDIHTVGTRWMPRNTRGTSANIELAYQFGETDDDRNLEAWMADAVVRQGFGSLPGAPVLGAGIYHITGNDPETNRDEGWNPLWARFPQYSELYVYAFDAEAAGRWSNVSMPYISLSCTPNESGRLALLAGYMSAPEKSGPGGGGERGWLGTARYDITLAQRVFTNKDRLFGHLLLEVFEPGDYYNVRKTAHFARWEISYEF